MTAHHRRGRRIVQVIASAPQPLLGGKGDEPRSLFSRAPARESSRAQKSRRPSSSFEWFPGRSRTNVHLNAANLLLETPDPHALDSRGCNVISRARHRWRPREPRVRPPATLRKSTHEREAGVPARLNDISRRNSLSFSLSIICRATMLRKSRSKFESRNRGRRCNKRW